MRAGLLLVAGLGGCPEPAADRMVHIQDGDLDYWIDAFEYPNRQGTRPTHGVTLAEAEQACADEGKRLCTAAEWRRACTGRDDLRFGYANRLIPNICRVGVEGVSHTSLVGSRAPREEERTGEGTAAAAGSYMDCVTPEGVHDLIGNVEEWVADDWNGRRGSLEGGAWYTHTRYADCSGRYSRQPDYRLDDEQPVASAGFRCCKSEAPPEPGRDARERLVARAPAVAYDPDNEVILGSFAMDRYEYPNRHGAAPVVGVSWTEAQEQCAEGGKRLCTAVEWEAACSEGGGAFPYGRTYVPSACAVAMEGPTASGAALACATPSGVADLVGSVWEWTATPLNEPGLGAAPRAEVRGGSWQTDADKSVCQPRDGYPFPATTARHGDLGFRCCRTLDAPPPTPPEPAPTCCPDGLVGTAGVCIDRFELALDPGQAPVSGVSFSEAAALCMARGLRICEEAEWEAACAGAAGRRWPYGDAYESGRCHLGAYAPGSSVEPRVADPDSPCATPDGVVDLSGNLWEWVQTDAGGALRGGGWDLSAGLGQCGVRATPPPDSPPSSAGVRCCTAALPACPQVPR